MAAKPQGGVELPHLSIQRVSIPIIGDTPLITHAWSQKARTEMLAKHMKKAAKGREAKDPWRNFVDCLYWLSDRPEDPLPADVEQGRFGFPAIGLKAAAVNACSSTSKALTKVGTRQAFHIEDEFVEILGPPPSMREDITRNATGVPDIRHRPEFQPWGAVLTVRVNTAVMSVEQVVALFDLAGFAVGIGDWRPERGGPYGRFHVAKQGEELPCR
jgi:hypothetical protein